MSSGLCLQTIQFIPLFIYLYTLRMSFNLAHVQMFYFGPFVKPSGIGLNCKQGNSLLQYS